MIERRALEALGFPPGEIDDLKPADAQLILTGGLSRLCWYALQYAAMGLYVFPLAQGAKEPVAGFGWADGAVNSPDLALELWRRHGMDCNIGLACGPSNVVVIDPDGKNGQDGPAAWATIAAERNIPPAAWQTITPNGGEHHFYQRNGHEVSNGKLRDNDGALIGCIDVKSAGGYVVLPPSNFNGREYIFEASSSILDQPLTPIPPELLPLLPSLDAQRDDEVFGDELPDVSNLAAVLGGLDPPGDVELYHLITTDPNLSAERAGKSRSEIDQSVVCRLVCRGASNDLIRAIFEAYPIGEKYREKRRHGRAYLARSIGSARQRDNGAGFDVNLTGAPRVERKSLLTGDYVALFEFWGYKFRVNQCNDDLELNGLPVTDHLRDTICAKVRDYGIATKHRCAVQHAKEAMSAGGLQNAYHPIKEYLDGLTWQGTDVIADLAGYFTAEPTFPRWLRHWLVGAVAKIYDGYQNPMLVLDSPVQGIGKSFFVQWLCPLSGWFSAGSIQPDNKDHKLKLLRCFVWEVEELGATTRRADVEALKAFLTLPVVRERKSYGRYETVLPPVASFIGTINDQAGFLVDRTGNRRFLPVRVTAIDWRYSREVDVNQVWAQAVHIYRTGGEWRLTSADVQDRENTNDRYMVSDPVETSLEQMMVYTGDVIDEVSNSEIEARLRLEGFQLTRPLSMTVAAVLKSWGCTSWRRRDGGQRTRGYSGVRMR